MGATVLINYSRALSTSEVGPNFGRDAGSTGAFGSGWWHQPGLKGGIGTGSCHEPVPMPSFSPAWCRQPEPKAPVLPASRPKFSPTSVVKRAQEWFISAAAPTLSSSSQLQAFGPNLTLCCCGPIGPSASLNPGPGWVSSRIQAVVAQ